MKTSILTLCLAVRALAHQALPLIKRDLATITGVLDNVKANIHKLDEAMDTAAAHPETLLLASNGLITALKSGAKDVNATDDLSFLDSIRLIRPVQEVTDMSTSLSHNLDKIRGVVHKMGLCEATRLQIMSISTNAHNLMDAVNSKLPQESQDISRELTTPLVEVLQHDQNTFSAQSCNAAGDGAAGVSSSASMLKTSLATVAISLSIIAVALTV